MPRRKQLGTLRTAMVLVLCASGAVGCTEYTGYRPESDSRSRDLFTFESTAWLPQTISIIDTRTDEVIWSVDVPVEKQVVIWFRQDEGLNDVYPDAMEWETFDRGTTNGKLFNRIAMPPPSARLIETSYRPAPEMPGAVLSEVDTMLPMPIEQRDRRTNEVGEEFDKDEPWLERKSTQN